MSLERHLTVDQAAAETGFPKYVIYDAVERKQLRVVRTGKGKNSRIRIPESAIVQWLESRTVHAEGIEPPAPVSVVVSRPARPRVRASSVSDLIPKGYTPRFSVQ